MAERLTELERKVDQMVVRGVIVETNPKEKWVVVAYGTDDAPMKTGKLPVKPLRAGKAIVWWFPEVGEGATVISPGDLRLGEVFPASYYSDRPAPSDDPDLFLVEFGDGSKVSHHRESGALDVVNVGDVTATVGGNTTLNCNKAVSVTAAKTVSVTAEGDLALTTDGNMTLKAGGNMKLEATRIDFN